MEVCATRGERTKPAWFILAQGRDFCLPFLNLHSIGKDEEKQEEEKGCKTALQWQMPQILDSASCHRA